MTVHSTALSSISMVALTGLLLFTIPTPVKALSDCGNLKGCENKICEIEKQLKISQQKGNEQKTDGLKTALNNAKKNCTDKGLQDDLVKEIREANEDIAEYESDLNEAKEYGKTEKVKKYQDKIKEEKSKIKALDDKLSELN